MAKRNLKSLFTNKEITDSALVLISNVLAQAVNFVAVMFMTKMLSVEDYGKYALLNTVLTLVADLSDMGMNASITRFVAQYRGQNDRASELGIIAYSLKRKLCSSALAIGLMMVFSNFLATYVIHDSAYSVYVILVSFCAGFYLLTGLYKAVFQGRQNFKHYFLSVAVDAIVYLATVVVLYAFQALSVFTIVLASLLRSLVSTVICAILVGVPIKELFSRISGNKETVKLFNTYSRWMFLWAIFSNLQTRADVLLLSQLTTTDQVSYYDIANKITKPVLLVVSSYSQIMSPVFAKLNTLDKIRKKISSVKKIVLAGTGGMLLAVALSGIAVRILFGNKYDNSIVPLQIMFAALIFYIWTIPYNSALFALNKPQVFTIAAGIGLVATVIGDFLLLPAFGAVGAAFTYFIAQLIGFLVAYIGYRWAAERSTLGYGTDGGNTA